MANWELETCTLSRGEWEQKELIQDGGQNDLLWNSWSYTRKQWEGGKIDTVYSWAADEKDLHYINTLAQFNFQEM